MGAERVVCGVARRLGFAKRIADVAFPDMPSWRWDRYLLASLYAAFDTVSIPERLLPMAYRVVGPAAVLTRTVVDGPSRRMISIDRDYFASTAGLRMPYFMHPSLYESGLWRRVSDFRQEPKRSRVLFAGTTSGYEPNQFTVFTRTDIVATIRDRFPDHPAIHLYTTDDTTDTLDKHAVQGADYLHLLASSWVFLAAPGYQMPHAHNVIEAMSVGAIPLIGYGHYFDPPLTDGENCIAFSDAETLVRAVEMILVMSEGRLRRMRANVLRHYDTVLRPEAFASKLHAASSPLRIVVNAEGESVEAFNRHAATSRQYSIPQRAHMLTPSARGVESTTTMPSRSVTPS